MRGTERLFARCVSPARRASIDATLAEAAATADAEEAARWRSAARGLLIRGILFGPVLKGVLLCLAIAAVATANESSSDVANQATLALIVGGAAVVGFVWARRAWLPGVLIGATVAVEHVVALALGVENPDVHLPPGWWSTTSLLVLLVPAVIGAYGGAFLRRAVSPRPVAP